MRISNATQRPIFALAAATILSFALSSPAAVASEAETMRDETYEWSANLISFDEAERSAVLQARVDTYRPIENLDEFAEGDQLILSWTGRFWASGIRGLARDPDLEPGTLALPVEFVSSERDGKYINFRIPVPADAVDAIADMDPGTRVTGTSPKMAMDWHEGVTMLRHYNDVD
jgi:hypothetical protein